MLWNPGPHTVSARFPQVTSTTGCTLQPLKDPPVLHSKVPKHLFCVWDLAVIVHIPFVVPPPSGTFIIQQVWDFKVLFLGIP